MSATVVDRDEIIGQQVHEAVVNGVHAVASADLDQTRELLQALVPNAA